MKIRREDGLEFDSEINALSLDDQQFVKNWLENRPENVDFRLEIAIDRKSVETEKIDSESLRFETKSNRYEITVRNLSRETLESARMEYVVVWQDGTTIHETDEGVPTYDRVKEGVEPPMVRVEGGKRLDPIPFNRDLVIETVPFDLEKVSYTEGQVLYADEPIGAVVRVLTSSGILLMEEKVGDARITEMSWEDAFALKAPSVES